MTPFERAIATLGTTKKSLMEKLSEMKIKGTRSLCFDCPVARYLKASGFPDVSVNSIACRYEGSHDFAIERVNLPSAIAEWVADFDNNRYPEFIDRNQRT